MRNLSALSWPQSALLRRALGTLFIALLALSTAPATYAAPSYAFTSGNPPNGTYGTAYGNTGTPPYFQFAATGASSYTITAGALPPGLTLTSNNGRLSGTPTQAGSFTFTVFADATFNPLDVSRQYTITIAKRALTVTANNKTKVYGEANPTLDFSVANLANGNTPAATLMGSPATAATDLSPVASYPITQGTVALSAAGALNYTLGSFVNGSLSVTKAPLTVTANDKSKVYGEVNPDLDVTVEGLVGSDTAEATLTGSLATEATDLSPVASYPIIQGDVALSAAGALNYTLSSFVEGSLSVTKAPLTVIANDKSKLYGDANPDLDYTVEGLVGSDTEQVTVMGSLATEATDLSPVASYPITVGSLELTAAGALNYDLNFVEGSLSVGKVTLTVMAADRTKVYGEDNPALIYTVDGLIGSDSEATVLTGSPTTEATAASSVGSYPITVGSLELTPAAALNYIFSFVEGTLSVSKADLTVTAVDQDRVYGSDNLPLDYTVAGLVNGDTEAATLAGSLATDATALSPVDFYWITQGTLALTDAGAINYNLAFVEGIVNVTEATLTVTAKDEVRRVGQPNPAFTILYSGFVGTDNASVLTSLPTASTQADVNSTDGVYDITVSGGSADNYVFDYVAGKLTITTKEIPTLTWATPAEIVYGTALGSTQLNAVATITSQPLAGTFTYDPATGTVLGAGNGQVLKVTFTPTDSANYATVSSEVQIDVAKAALTATAANKSRTYGAANPALTFSVAGLVNGDAQAVVLAGDVTTEATAASAAGSYPITQGNLGLTTAGATNYTFSFTPGSLTVTKAALTATAASKSRTYGAANPALTFNVVGLVNGDTQATMLTGSLATGATTASDVGSYPITKGSLALTAVGAGNYTLSFTQGSLTVTKAALTVKANNATRRVGESNPTFTAIYSGFVNGQGAAALDGSLKFSTTATAASPKGTYDIVPSGLTSSNYVITFVKGTLTVLEAGEATQTFIYLPLIRR